MFIRRKKVCVDRLTWAVQRERVVPSWYEMLTWSNFFWVSFGQSSCFAWFWVHAWFILFLCCVCAHLSAKMYSSKKGYGWSLVKRPIYLLPHFHHSGRGGCSFPTFKQFSSQVSYNSAQSWHYLPDNSLRSHKWRVQSYNFKCQSQA